MNFNILLDIRKSPHILVSGITGSAKSTVLMGLNLHFMTSKAIGDKRVVSTPTMAANLLRILVNNMEARYAFFHGEFGKDFSAFKKDVKIFRPIIITIDELSALLLDAKNRSEILNYITKLVLLGRQAGFFVITGIQRP